MKRILSLVLLFSLISASAGFSATKKIPVVPLKLITKIANSDETSGIVVSGETIVVFGTKTGKAFARAIDTQGQELWNIFLDPAPASIATAGTVDDAGNIWIAGSTSRPRATANPTPSVSPLNPDNVVNIPDIFNPSLNTIALWKIEVGTSIPTLFSAEQNSPVLVTSVAVDKNGVAIVGITATGKGTSGFVISANLAGNFGTSTIVGVTSTTLETVIRHADGSLTVAGASGETLKGKKLVGFIDGVLITITNTGLIASVIRSSAPKAKRNWLSASTSLLLGGEVVTGKKTESAITKFSKTYSPLWSHRFESTGLTITYGQKYAFFASTSVISQLSNWSPKKSRPILIAFDARGRIAQAFTVPVDQRDVVALISSKTLGLLCLTSNADAISIYSLV